MRIGLLVVVISAVFRLHSAISLGFKRRLPPSLVPRRDTLKKLPLIGRIFSRVEYRPEPCGLSNIDFNCYQNCIVQCLVSLDRLPLIIGDDLTRVARELLSLREKIYRKRVTNLKALRKAMGGKWNSRVGGSPTAFLNAILQSVPSLLQAMRYHAEAPDSMLWIDSRGIDQPLSEVLQHNTELIGHLPDILVIVLYKFYRDAESVTFRPEMIDCPSSLKVQDEQGNAQSYHLKATVQDYDDMHVTAHIRCNDYWIEANDAEITRIEDPVTSQTWILFYEKT